jgi:signal transduction histidine kinase
VRSRLLSVANGAAGALGFEPRVLFDGPIDTVVEEDLGAELLAVAREALSNVARHADASSVEVGVRVSEHEVCLEVTDDGAGPPAADAPRGHGLHNMEERARQRSGTFELLPREGGGSTARWRVPRP